MKKRVEKLADGGDGQKSRFEVGFYPRHNVGEGEIKKQKLRGRGGSQTYEATKRGFSGRREGMKWEKTKSPWAGAVPGKTAHKTFAPTEE